MHRALGHAPQLLDRPRPVMDGPRKAALSFMPLKGGISVLAADRSRSSWSEAVMPTSACYGERRLCSIAETDLDQPMCC